jgi:hypothetical protein
VVRSGAEIARFFDGLDLVDPGLVQVDQWRPSAEAEPQDPAGADQPPVPIYGALGRKP